MPLSRTPPRRLHVLAISGRSRLWPACIVLILAGCAAVTPPPAPVVEAPATVSPTPAANEVWISLPPDQALARLRSVPWSPALRARVVPVPAAGPSALELQALPRVTPYVDCGTARLVTADGKSRELPVATDFQQFRQRVNGKDYAVWRSMQLRVNARVEIGPRPDRQPGASLRYSPRFTLIRERLVSDGSRPMIFRDEIEFASGEAARFPNAVQPCRSNGRLEQTLHDTLLALEKPPAPTAPKAGRATRRRAPARTTIVMAGRNGQ